MRKFLYFLVSVYLCFSWRLNAQIKLEKLGPGVNTDEYDEICPVISRDHNTLYFTRVGAPDFNRTLIYDDADLAQTNDEVSYFNSLKNIFGQISKRLIDDPVSSFLNQDVWIAESRNGLFDYVHHPLYPINNALPNSVCSLSPLDNTLIITNHYYTDGSMYEGFSFITKKEDQDFEFPKPIHITNYHSQSPEVNLSMSADGDIIILSLKRSDGYGEMDLYVCFKIKENLWSEPVNLGPTINSRYRDLTPHITNDKTRLYFASNRPGGLGGTDIYVSYREDYSWKKWTTPQLLKSPINSEYDDSNPIIIEPNAYIYFTSKRDKTSDIYRVSFHSTEVTQEPITIRGVFKSSVTNAIIDGTLLYGYSDLNFSDLKSVPVIDEFKLKFDIKEVYRLSPRKPGYIGKNQMIDINILDRQRAKEYMIEFFLTPLHEEQKLDLNNIYFERGTAVVRQDSYTEIDRLARLMNENTSAQIRIEGHTDSVGVDYELLDLSRQRAESIKKYLVLNKNIGSNRINTFGYGGTKPISPNNSEEYRAKNRRVEIYLTQANLIRKVDPNSIPNPVVTPIFRKESGLESKTKPEANKAPIVAVQKQVASVPEIKVSENPPVNNLSQTPEYSTPLAPVLKKQYEFAQIQFVENELAIKQNSFDFVRSLIDLAKAKPECTILISGYTKSDESLVNAASFALSRAKGIKEYLVFKSIEATRIQIIEPADKKEFAGVVVQILEL